MLKCRHSPMELPEGCYGRLLSLHTVRPEKRIGDVQICEKCGVLYWVPVKDKDNAQSDA